MIQLPMSARCTVLTWDAREAPDAPEDLPKEAPGQVTFGQLEDEVPSVPSEPPAGPEQPLLETREGPALDGDGQDETGEARPVGGAFALFDPLLRRPTLVVEADDGPVGPGQGGDDEAHPRKQLAE